MDAYKCDRCGNLFERRCVPDVVVTRYVHGYDEEKLDLCKKCYLELIKFCRFSNQNYLIESADICYEED